ncbi:MAG: hypothetical protein KAG20_06625, partial [Cocleimonas sp.]|nr:hypothetical protein [Cocleimonas sp.]
NDDFSNLTLDIALVPTLDFGDAPVSYGDAGHLVPLSPKVYLGALFPDKEARPQHSANGGADGVGDDNNKLHDEDSIQLLNPLQRDDTRFQMNISAHNTSTKNAKLIAWLDLNNNGTFDVNEAATATVAPRNGGTIPLVWDNIPAGTLQTDTLWLRIRLSTDSGLDSTNAAGALADGEVEDYAITVGSGVKVSGYVFNDDNVSTRIKEAADIGIANVTVVLHDTANNSCISLKTNTAGYYQFNSVIAGQYTLYEAANEVINTPKNCPANEKDPTGYRSTTANTRHITVASTAISHQDFGDVLQPRFSPHHSGTVLPNNTIFYTHKFTAQSHGTVSFTKRNEGGETTGWATVIYRDNDCNGKLEGIEAAAPITATIAVVTGETICLLNKVYAPSAVLAGETYSNYITADFDYANALAGIARLNVTDITKASVQNTPAGSSRLELRKTVQNISQNTAETDRQNKAKPGDILKYRIYYSNTGTGAITDLMVNDSVPEFTLLHANSANCDSTPVGLNCSPVELDPDVDWRFTGTLKGGAKGWVSYEVIIE